MSPLCREGHDSTAEDFCDVCGLELAPSAPTDLSKPPTEPSAEPIDSSSSPSVQTKTCPHCGEETNATDEFCENCGFDFATGVAVADPEAATGAWEAVVSADRSYFDRFDAAGAEFPTDYVERRVTLSHAETLIGRRSESKHVEPEIDLAQPPEDIAVSHVHAVLQPDGDGWSLVDQGSTNGTYLNDDDEPIVAGKVVALAAGDRIHVGAWTTITLHILSPADGEPGDEGAG